MSPSNRASLYRHKTEPFSIILLSFLGNHNCPSTVVLPYWAILRASTAESLLFLVRTYSHPDCCHAFRLSDSWIEAVQVGCRVIRKRDTVYASILEFELERAPDLRIAVFRQERSQASPAHLQSRQSERVYFQVSGKHHAREFACDSVVKLD